jgi:putative CocE/NonD family hydrolase
LYLSTDGGLRQSPPAPGETVLTIDPLDPVPTLGGANLHPWIEVAGREMGAGSFDQRSIENRDDVLTFTTAALERPLTVMGRVRAHLWIRPDTPDLDLAVRLTDVYPDGRSMLVLDGIQRARMRCGDDHECFLIPGEPAELVIDLWSTAIVFNAGHRVRVAISGTNSPRFEPNPNDGSDLDQPDGRIVARPALLFGPETPSRLQLPVVGGPRLPTRRDTTTT